MNQELFNKLWEERPAQWKPEWLMFLEICEMYIIRYEIEKPLVVELGTRKCRQKKFYKQLLGADHIGIDISSRFGMPDILGDTRDLETFKILKTVLAGRSIDILFIDALHSYKNVKKDFRLYAPLCTGIIALHDIELGRHQDLKSRGVWKFWDELKLQGYSGNPKYKDSLLMSMHQYKGTGDRSQPGIGLVMKWIKM